jgi:hypothetical protein
VAGSGEVQVEIRGLREFRAQLRRLDAAAPEAASRASKRSAELVIDHARPRIPTGPARNGHARDTLRAVDAGRRSFVRAGGESHPYYPWLDFGGRVGIRASVRREYIKEGRYIFPAYSAVFPQIKNVIDDELREATRAAGLAG